MSGYATGNPVPSIDPRDLDDNATVLDNLVSGPALVYFDRLGKPRKSWAGMELDAQALTNPNVTALAGLTGAADRMPYFTGQGALALAVLTTAARTFNAAASAAAQRTVLELGSAALLAAGSPSGVATLGADGKLPVSQLPPLAINETFTVASQAAMLALTAQRGDVAIRSDLNGAAYLLTADAPATLANWVPIQQNLGAALTALSALTPAADTLPYFNGSAGAATTPLTPFARTLLDDTSQATARTTLGVLAATDKPAWTPYTPVVTAASGTYTTVTATGRFLILFGICYVQITITFTTRGTGTLPIVSLPAQALANSGGMALLAQRTSGVAVTGGARIQVADHTKLALVASDGGAIDNADGAIVTIAGNYPIA